MIYLDLAVLYSFQNQDLWSPAADFGRALALALALALGLALGRLSTLGAMGAKWPALNLF